MKSLFKYGKALFFNIISLLVLLFLLTIVYYFNGISDKTYQLLKLIILLVSIFIQSFSLGKRRDNKRYLEGLYYGCIIIILLLLFSIISHHFQIKVLFYYLMILSTSILGSMFGKKKK